MELTAFLGSRRGPARARAVGALARPVAAQGGDGRDGLPCGSGDAKRVYVSKEEDSLKLPAIVGEREHAALQCQVLAARLATLQPDARRHHRSHQSGRAGSGARRPSRHFLGAVVQGQAAWHRRVAARLRQRGSRARWWVQRPTPAASRRLCTDTGLLVDSVAAGTFSTRPFSAHLPKCSIRKTF